MHSAIKLSPKLSLAFFITLNNPLCFAQVNPAYLQLLDGDASHLSLDEKTKTKSKKPTKVNPSNHTFTDEGIPQGLSFDDFMNHLKVNYIGTYLFAKRLSTSNQNNIYAFYQKNTHPHDIRAQVIKLNKIK